ncbi:hypothetical protein [Bacteroides caecimuris]|nr:hypothetical protein [Bacteroides caecimuris]
MNFLWLQVANRLLLKSLQAALAKPTTVTQCKGGYNAPIIKGISEF